MQIQSNVLLHEQGYMAIMFDDPNFTRSETIVFDQTTGYLHAVLEGKAISIGQISGQLKAVFARQTSVQLSSLRPDGSVLDLQAKVVVIH